MSRSGAAGSSGRQMISSTPNRQQHSAWGSRQETNWDASGGNRPHSARSLDGGRSASRMIGGGVSPGVHSGYGGSRGFAGLYQQQHSAAHHYHATPSTAPPQSNSTGGFSRNIACRKMQDPAAKNDALRTIIRYLTNKGFVRQVTVQELQTPTKPLYTAIIEFLMLQVDPSLKVKDDDDICKFYKDLNCPLVIPRSAVKAPGTPTTWPTLLTGMAWLCELLQWDEMTNQQTGGEQGALERTWDEQLQLCYRMNAEGRIDASAAAQILEQHQETLFEYWAQRNNGALTESEQLQKSIQEKEKILKEREERKKATVRLTVDVEKLEQAIEKCKQSVIEIRNSNKVKEIALTEKKQKQEDVEVESQRLQRVIEKQEINMDQVRQIEEQMTQKSLVRRQLLAEKAATDNERLHLETEVRQMATRQMAQGRDHNAVLDVCKTLSQKPNCGLTATTIKALRNTKALDLTLDDVAIDECSRNALTSTDSSSEAEDDEDAPLAVEQENGKGVQRCVVDSKVGCVDLSKSTPAECGMVKGARKRTAALRDVLQATQAVDVDNLLGIRWQAYKKSLAALLSTEQLSTAKAKKAEEEHLETFKRMERQIGERRSEIDSATMKIESAQREVKSLRRTHAKHKETCRLDVEHYKAEYRQLEIDLTTRIEDAKRRKECLASQSDSKLKEYRNEVKAAKVEITRMVRQAFVFRADCETKMKEFASKAIASLVGQQEAASEAYRRLGAYPHHGLRSPPTESSG